MRKTKEVLRLRFEVGLGRRHIARSCSIALGTVHEYLQRAEVAGVTWPLGEDWDDDRLEAALLGGPPRAHPAVLYHPGMPFGFLPNKRSASPESSLGAGGGIAAMIGMPATGAPQMRTQRPVSVADLLHEIQ